MKKMTIASKFDEVIAILEGKESAFSVDDAIAFIKERQEQAQKKGANKKETERQKENEVLKGAILDALNGADEGKTVTEILSSDAVASFETAEPLSNQRVTAVLRLMITKDGTVRKDKIGNAMKYFVA